MDLNGDSLVNVPSRDRISSKTGLRLQSVVYLIALAAAEYVTNYISINAGLILYFGILFGLVINIALIKDATLRPFWLALGLASIIRILSITMPVSREFPQVFEYIFISIAILAGIIAIIRINKYSLADVGLNRKNPVLQTIVAASGLVIGAGGYFLLKPEAWTTELTIRSALLSGLVLLICTGLVEEIAYRGVMQRAAGVLGAWGWVYVAAIYGVSQIGQKSIFYCIFAFAVSLFFGWVVKKTGSIWGVGLAHGLINIGLFLIFPNIF